MKIHYVLLLKVEAKDTAFYFLSQVSLLSKEFSVDVKLMYSDVHFS